METTTKKPQTLKGLVVKTAMKDTATVLVSRYVEHPKYKKYQTRSKKYLVHNTDNQAKEGDTVMIVACKPISKRKSFTIKSVVKRGGNVTE